MAHLCFFGLQQQPGYRALIEVEQERCALARGNHIHHLIQQLFGASPVQPHVGFWFQNWRHLVDHFQQGVGQIIGQVGSIGSHPRDRKQLPIPGSDTLVSARADHRIVGRVTVYPKTLEDLLAKLTIHTLFNRFLPGRE